MSRHHLVLVSASLSHYRICGSCSLSTLILVPIMHFVASLVFLEAARAMYTPMSNGRIYVVGLPTWVHQLFFSLPLRHAYMRMPVGCSMSLALLVSRIRFCLHAHRFYYFVSRASSLVSAGLSCLPLAAAPCLGAGGWGLVLRASAGEGVVLLAASCHVSVCLHTELEASLPARTSEVHLYLNPGSNPRR